MSTSLRCFKHHRSILRHGANSSAFVPSTSPAIRRARFATNTSSSQHPVASESLTSPDVSSETVEPIEAEQEPYASSSSASASETERGSTRAPRESRRPFVKQRIFPKSVSPTRFTRSPSVPTVEPYFADHLNGVFEPLVFPDELARRVLTHSSHPAAQYGHNGAFSFLGRRVLESYLLLFLNSSSALRSTHDVQEIASQTLHTHVLGEHVGSQWGIGRILRWTPSVSEDKFHASANASRLTAREQEARAVMRGTGLYKVQGDAVAAVMGGIFFQFGGVVAHRVFHTKLLPLILLPRKREGLPEVFHEDARRICDQMEVPEPSLSFSSANEQSSSVTYPAQQVIIPDASTSRVAPRKAVV